MNPSKRLGASLSIIIAGGVLGLVAIASRPSDIQGATRATDSQPLRESEAQSEASRSLMIDGRPVLGELLGEGERTVILGGDGVSYLDQGPAGEFFESVTDHDSMYAKPIQLMLVDLPESW